MNRKLKAFTNESSLYFIRNIRLQKALELLKADADNVAGISFTVGFEDPGYFTKVFKKHFGFLPSDIKKI